MSVKFVNRVQRRARACARCAYVGLAALTLIVGCRSDTSGPGIRPTRLDAWDGDGQFGNPGVLLARELQVRVVDATTGSAREDVQVQWRVIEGQGAALTSTVSTTAVTGIASVGLQLGEVPGEYRVEARVGELASQVVTMSARAVETPHVDAVQPSSVAAGQVVTVQGANFSTVAVENTVLFGGFRGSVENATGSSLTVRAPICLPNRSVELRVALGDVTSGPINVTGQAADVPALDIQPGEGFVASSASDLTCIRLDFEDGTEYLLVPQSAPESYAPDLRMELVGLVKGTLVTIPSMAWIPQVGRDDWELALRQRERQFEGGMASRQPDEQLAIGGEPQVGDRRTFRVLNQDGGTDMVTAEIRVVTPNAVLYEDLDAPASGFTPSDYQTLGALFQDPIYPTVTSVFGQPSDIDGNGRIIILFSPRVNALTPRNQGTFIVGFFYGCDLVPSSRCSDTNGAEVFYSMVPDPSGEYSDARSKGLVERNVPSVLAHEFQHMISFARRNQSLDELWLSEGLAHAAEDVVGDVFVARGDMSHANDFKANNFNRASRYLGATSRSPLLAVSGGGSLETRGGAWLFVKYITGHYGENDLLQRMTGSSQKGVANVVAETGQPWRRLLGEFSVALWATEAPELDGVQVAQRFQFADLELRRLLELYAGTNPLQPVTLGTDDFGLFMQLAPGGASYYRVRHEPGTLLPLPLHITATGANGAVFSQPDAAGLTIFRIR